MRPVLDQFAYGLKGNPAATVRIIGYTDSTGTDAINNPLSVNRAASTRDYLASHGVDPNRIVIDGRVRAIRSPTTTPRRVAPEIAVSKSSSRNRPTQRQHSNRRNGSTASSQGFLRRGGPRPRCRDFVRSCPSQP
jgi:hypothetical protein